MRNLGWFAGRWEVESEWDVCEDCDAAELDCAVGGGGRFVVEMVLAVVLAARRGVRTVSNAALGHCDRIVEHTSLAGRAINDASVWNVFVSELKKHAVAAEFLLEVKFGPPLALHLKSEHGRDGHCKVHKYTLNEVEQKTFLYAF